MCVFQSRDQMGDLMTEITGKTQIMLMLADPVGHIRGSALINDHFDKMGLDVAIVPLHVAPEDLSASLHMISRIKNVVGLGITIPHKIAAVSLMDELTDTARRLGAVNFVRRNADGTFTGHNIDGEGFICGLRKNGFLPEGKKAMMVGTGGVGRAIAFALVEAGVAELLIANRTHEKAQELAADIVKAIPHASVHAVAVNAKDKFDDLDLLINATSLGMHAGEPLPLDLAGLREETTVAEVIIHPKMTPLLEIASKRGCRIVTGDAMLLPQPELVAKFVCCA